MLIYGGSVNSHSPFGVMQHKTIGNRMRSSIRVKTLKRVGRPRHHRKKKVKKVKKGKKSRKVRRSKKKKLNAKNIKFLKKLGLQVKKP